MIDWKPMAECPEGDVVLVLWVCETDDDVWRIATHATPFGDRQREFPAAWAQVDNLPPGSMVEESRAFWSAA